MIEFPSRDELMGRIDTYEGRYERGIKGIREREEREQENATNLIGGYNSLTQDCLNIAVSYLLLNDMGASKPWFERYARYRIQSEELRRRYPDEVTRKDHQKSGAHLNQALIGSFLSGNRELVMDAVDMTQSLEESYIERFSASLPVQWYHRAKLLAAIAVGEEDPDTHINAMRSVQLDSVSEGTLQSCEGILMGDVETAKGGIEKLIASHTEDTLRGEQPSRSKDYLAFTASGLLVLAHSKGLRITVESPYLPDPLYDIGLDI